MSLTINKTVIFLYELLFSDDWSKPIGFRVKFVFVFWGLLGSLQECFRTGLVWFSGVFQGCLGGFRTVPWGRGLGLFSDSDSDGFQVFRSVCGLEMSEPVSGCLGDVWGQLQVSFRADTGRFPGRRRTFNPVTVSCGQGWRCNIRAAAGDWETAEENWMRPVSSDRKSAAVNTRSQSPLKPAVTLHAIHHFRLSSVSFALAN